MRPKKIILLVDADAASLATRRFAIETRGYYCVVTAGSGDEALELIGAHVPRHFDLLACELRMPGMNGDELARRARQMCPELRTLLFCATSELQDCEIHADAFLPKQVLSTSTLLERIKILVARKRGPKTPQTYSEMLARKAEWKRKMRVAEERQRQAAA